MFLLTWDDDTKLMLMLLYIYYYVLSQITRKAARKMVMATPNRNGYEAFRRLFRQWVGGGAEGGAGLGCGGTPK